MVKVAFEGVLLGLTVAILIGPAFFALIQTSLLNGFRSGVAFAIGIFLSDLLFVWLAYLGASKLFESEENKLYVGIGGGLILIGFGIFNLLQREVKNGRIRIKTIPHHLMITKGFLVNLLNPFVFLFWVGAVGIVSSRPEVGKNELMIFFITGLGTILATDVLKSYIAKRLSNYLSPKRLILTNKIAGIVLIVFGAVLIYKVIPGLPS